MIYNYIIRYPFLSKAKEFLESENIDLFNVDEKILKLAAKFILDEIGLDYGSLEKRWLDRLKIQDERMALLFVKMYPVSKIFISLIDNVPLLQTYATYYQKQFKYFIAHPLNSMEFEDILSDLCPNAIHTENDNYKISIIDLLSFDLGQDYNLQYANLDNGYIYFSKEELIDLLSILVKKQILRIKEIGKDDVPKIFFDYAQFIKNKLQDGNLLKSTFNISKKVELDEFPPCFKKLYSDLISGHKLSHIGNYHLAVFLANINFNYNEVLEVFRHLPNFDEKIAGYQIQKIIEKQYSVANCETLKANNLCVNDCKVKHPLQLIKDKDNTKNKVKKDDEKQ